MVQPEQKSLENLISNLKAERRLKEIKRGQEDTTAPQNMRGVNEECLNLDRILRELEVTVQCFSTCSSNQTVLLTRDYILYKLSLLWEIYHILATKEKEKICPSLYKFCLRLCKENSIVHMLATCLNSDDHFIAFQAHKLWREIVAAFPEIVMDLSFQDIISKCFREVKENGQWAVLYSVEIIKEVLTPRTSLDGMKCKKKYLSHDYPQRYCTIEEGHGAAMDFQAVLDFIHNFWSDYFKQWVVNHLGVAENQAKLTSGQHHVLASLLSLGSMVMQSYGRKRTNEIFHSKHMYLEDNSETSLRPNFAADKSITEKVDVHLQLNPHGTSYHGNMGKDNVILSCGPAEILSVKMMESVQIIVEKLVEIDKSEYPLYLRRAILHFLSSVVGDSYQFSSAVCQNEIKSDRLVHLVPVCTLLIENTDILLSNIPEVCDGVHFGGLSPHSISSEDIRLDNFCYDGVEVRKVLLLILKSLLTAVTGQKLKLCNWKVLKQCLQSWLNFVIKAVADLCKNSCPHDTSNPKVIASSIISLFADQDDELMILLLCLFNLFQELFLNQSLFPEMEETNRLHVMFNPHRFFLEFLRFVHYDHSLLLDFLISNETCFLHYLLLYLRHAANDWKIFLETAKECDTLCEEQPHQNQTTQEDDAAENTFDKVVDDKLSYSSICSNFFYKNCSCDNPLASMKNDFSGHQPFSEQSDCSGEPLPSECPSFDFLVGKGNSGAENTLLECDSSQMEWSSETNYFSCSQDVKEDLLTGNSARSRFTLPSENGGFVLQDRGTNSCVMNSRIESFSGMEWGSGDHLVCAKNVGQSRDDDMAVCNSAALLSIMNDYGELSSTSSDDDVDDDDNDDDGDDDDDGHDNNFHGQDCSRCECLSRYDVSSEDYCREHSDRGLAGPCGQDGGSREHCSVYDGRDCCHTRSVGYDDEHDGAQDCRSTGNQEGIRGSSAEEGFGGYGHCSDGGEDNGDRFDADRDRSSIGSGGAGIGGGSAKCFDCGDSSDGGVIREASDAGKFVAGSSVSAGGYVYIRSNVSEVGVAEGYTVVGGDGCDNGRGDIVGGSTKDSDGGDGRGSDGAADVCAGNNVSEVGVTGGRTVGHCGCSDDGSAGDSYNGRGDIRGSSTKGVLGGDGSAGDFIGYERDACSPLSLPKPQRRRKKHQNMCGTVLYYHEDHALSPRPLPLPKEEHARKTTTSPRQQPQFSPALLPDESHLRKSLSCLIRLRLSIERMAAKKLFPYRVDALVRLIKCIETLYEDQ